MKRFALPSPTGDGYAVARGGAFIATTLENDGYATLAAARRAASDLNDDYAREQAQAAPVDPADRPIPRGLYTDEDAK